MDPPPRTRDLQDPSEAQVGRWRAVVDDGSARPQDLVEVFLDGKDPRLRLAAITHANMTEAHVDALIESGGSRGDLVLSTTSRQEILARYAKSVSPEQRGFVAFNASTSAGTAESLAKDLHPDLRVDTAYCPQLSARTRVFLSRHDPDRGVRKEVFKAMTDAQMRMVLEGARIATMRGEVDAGSGDREIWVLCMPVQPLGDVEKSGFGADHKVRIVAVFCKSPG